MHIDCALDVNAHQDPRQVRQDRADLGAVAQHIDTAGGAGPRQIMIDLTTHGADLAADLLGQGPGGGISRCRIGLAGQHTERRLEEMRQVGNMGAGAAHHFGTVGDEGIEFGGERRDLGGGNVLPGAGRCRRECAPEIPSAA